MRVVARTGARYARTGVSDSPSQPSNEALVHAAVRQERQAIESLLVRHLPTLRGWIRLRMGPTLRTRETADDLVQSVAREVLADLSQFEWRGEAAFRHWLFCQAQTKLAERARFVGRARRDPAREEHEPDSLDATLVCYRSLCTPSAELAAREAVARIEAAFDALPADHKEAITLQRLCGMSYPELAAQLGRSEGAVRNLVYRGLARLALTLDRSGMGAGE